MVQLQQQFPGRLHAIALNVDFDDQGEPSDELKESVQSTLAKRGVTVESIMSSDPFEAVLEEFDLFGLPAALVYDPDGNLLNKFEGKVDYQADVAPLLGNR